VHWVLRLKGTIMNWETPSFEEIDMSAEIGSYQGEDDNGL
jgi:coenzyme PQQ precursor peptide PqqA